ncbi:MAG: MMPL family transporter [Myxococcales bacterium]|nr:MMPL family transporter [Myxococcales bacterium]
MSACSLGIVVDATVHFLSKYLRHRTELESSSEEAVSFALTTVGEALWVTFLVLGCGFAVLAFSSFKMNADFGRLVALTIAAAIVAAFLLLPSLLLKLDRSVDPRQIGS